MLNHRHITIPGFFEDLAQEMPGATALMWEGGSLSFGRLNQLANIYANLLLQRGIGLGSMVGLYGQRSPELVVGLVATLKAGAAYVPIDTAYPSARISRVIDDGQIRVVLTPPTWSGESKFGKGECIRIDLGFSRSAAQDPKVHLFPESPAAVIYTSGSEGRPKGVVIPHRAIVHRAEESMKNGLREYRSMQATSLWRSSLSVIGHVSNLLIALMAGRKVAIANDEMIASTVKLRETIREYLVPVVALLPSQLHMLLEGGTDFNAEPLRKVVLSGEAPTERVLQMARTQLHGVSVLNAYGTTETTGLVSYAGLDSNRTCVSTSGLGENCLIVGPGLEPVPAGTVGELCVFGPQLASCYLRNPRLTAERFVASSRGVPGGRMYRTGDLAKWHADGILEIVGRQNQEVKVRGFRVNLAEVENCLRANEAVDHAAVIHHDNDLHAFVVARQDVRAIQEYIAQFLPSWALPRTITSLHQFPLLASGKVDRVALARMTLKRGNNTPDMIEQSECERGSTTMLKEIITIFQDVLEISGINSTDDFRSLGGDSLQAIRIANRLEPLLQRRVGPREIESAESILSLAKRLEAGTSRQEAPPPSVSGATAQRARSSAQRAVTINRLIRLGQLERAREEAHALLRDHADLSFAQNITGILDRLPGEGRHVRRFRDDPSKEIQVIPSPGSNTLILLFCGKLHALGLPLSLVHCWFQHYPATLVYLRDFRRLHYFAGLRHFGGGRQEMLAGLKNLIAQNGAKRVMCWGNSAGTSAALTLGVELGAEAVVGLAGPINFTKEFNDHLRSEQLTARLRINDVAQGVDIRRALASTPNPPKTTLVYGSLNLDDRRHAESLGDLPFVRLLPIPECSEHNVLPELIRRGWMQDLVASFI